MNQPQQLIERFRWRERSGNLIAPCDMETRHLFYVIRMFWNHSAPEHLKLKPYQKYRFKGSFYTKEYVIEAITQMAAELDKRPTIPWQYCEQLDFMREHFNEFKGISYDT